MLALFPIRGETENSLHHKLLGDLKKLLQNDTVMHTIRQLIFTDALVYWRNKQLRMGYTKC
jgi:hypothetical protein